jgi:hypothetical protein
MVTANASTAPFLDSPTLDQEVPDFSYYDSDLEKRVAIQAWSDYAAKKFERLENSECIKEYTLPLSEYRRHLILVISGYNMNATDKNSANLSSRTASFPSRSSEFEHLSNDAGYCSQYQGYDWVCAWDFPAWQCSTNEDGTCSSKAKSINPQTWKTFGNFQPKYCLSERIQQSCRLRFSSSLAWVVIAFNILKLGLLLVCCLPKGPLSRERPLLTVGDTISTFLRQPDSTSKHLSAMSVFELNRWVRDKTRARKRQERGNLRLVNVFYPSKPMRYAHGVPLQRWIILTLL